MIHCSNVYAAYGNRQVLNDISFKANKNEFIAILGQNGSGKSTLLKVLSGLLPMRCIDKQKSGKVHIMENDLNMLNPRQRAKSIAVVTQKIDFLPQLSVHDMVLLGRYPHLSWFGHYRKNDYHIAQSVMEEIGIEHLSHRPLSNLSGGELQRVLLAKALAQQSPILLLDEPMVALDLAKTQAMLELLEKRCANGNLVLAVMHDINIAALYATRLIALKNGQVAFDGPIKKVFTSQNLQNVYEIDLHVFTHPKLGLPQACPSRN